MGFYFLLRRAHIPARFVFTDMFPTENIEHMTRNIGFLDEEVDQLYNIYKKITKNPKILRIELKEWYDGYRAAAGDYLYNPRSVVCALRDNQLAN